jgi:cation:H+ antiporter
MIEINDPSILISILLLAAGIAMLYFGAEGLVKGSVRLAIDLGITPLVIGLTVVALGTSSPELVVSLIAGLEGNSEIALGNVIGSNICNIALILGISAMIKPMKVEKKLLKTDVLYMIGFSVILIFFILDGSINWYEGLIFTILIVAYIAFTFYKSRKAKMQALPDEVKAEMKANSRPMLNIALVIFGFGLLILGANIFLEGAISIAKYLGVSNAIIGLSLVAFGTSLPELATSIVASVKNENDIILGNAIGSNIFNILLILGVVSMIFPINAAEFNFVDFAVMLGISIILIPLAYQKMQLTRWNGFLLLIMYIAYVYYLYIK